MRTKTVKLLEKKKRNLHDFGFDNGFYDVTLKHKQQNKNVNKTEFSIF